MRAFLTLIDKEWRNARVLVIGTAVLAVAAVWVIQGVFGEWRHPELTGRIVVPAVVALFAAVVCSDLAADERTSRRAGTFALLPVPGAAHWAAKVLFALSAIAAFTVWIAATAVLLHGFMGVPDGALAVAEEMFEIAPRTVLISLAIAGCSFFWSMLLPRGLSAALAGIVLACGAAYGGSKADFLLFGFEPFTRTDAFLAAAVLGVALALGVLLVFARGAAHASSLARRARLVSSSLVAFAALASVTFATAAYARTSLSPGDPETRILSIAASPDGSRVALTVSRAGQEQRRVWIVDTATSDVLELPGRTNDVWGFAEDGSVNVAELALRQRYYYEGSRWFDYHSRVVAYRRIDATTGRTVRLVPESEVREARKAARARNAPWATFDWDPMPAKRPQAAMWPLQVRVHVAGQHLATLTTHGFASLAPSRGHVLYQPERGLLVRDDLFTGARLFELPVIGANCRVSLANGGRSLVVSERYPEGGATVRIVNALTGRPQFGPFGAREPGARLSDGVWATPTTGSWLMLRKWKSSRHTGSELLNLNTGARRVLRPARNDTRIPPSAVIPGVGTAFAEGPRIVVVDDDGQVVRTYLDLDE